MHIPGSMLNNVVCPVTAVIASVGVGAAIYFSKKNNQKPGFLRFSSVTALVFALQMLNYPVQNGTSGHLVGAMLAVSFLGVPFSILSMSMVLVIQAFFFADGGVNALGANIINMALIGAGVSGVVYNYLLSVRTNQKISLGIASFISVLLAALVCSFEVAMSGAIELGKVLPAMISIHALIAFGECFLTVLVVSVLCAYKDFCKANERGFIFAVFSLAVAAVLFSPFASGFPDGLEWVCEKLHFAEFGCLQIPALFSDYQVPFLNNAFVSTIFAGFFGLVLIYGLTFIFIKSGFNKIIGGK